MLDIGSVGLYELIDLLQHSEFALGAEEMVDVAWSVASEVIARDRAQIRLLRWPKDAIIDGPLSSSVLREVAAWNPFPTHLYFALIPSQ